MNAGCPQPLRRRPTDRPLEWFTHGRGRHRWITLAEAAKIEGVTKSGLSRRIRAGCPHSVKVAGRVFIYRPCLDEYRPCDGLTFLDSPPPTPQERATERARRRAEWVERRAARERHATRVKLRQFLMVNLKKEWKKSGAPWKFWLGQKQAFKRLWKTVEARELGRDALRLAGKPIDTPEAEREAYRLGWKEIAVRYAQRLSRRIC